MAGKRGKPDEAAEPGTAAEPGDAGAPGPSVRYRDIIDGRRFLRLGRNVLVPEDMIQRIGHMVIETIRDDLYREELRRQYLDQQP